MSTITLVTAEQLLCMPSDGCRYELVAGELKRMTPAGWRHGAVAGRLHGKLDHYVEEHELGTVFTAETGFLLRRNPDTVRAPDIAFIHKHNFPAALPEDSFWPGAPDLAVEVVSPNDTIREIEERVRAWLDAGTKMVWVVNPKWRTVSVHRSATDPTTLTEKDELTGGDVVPGFRCRVRDVFAAS